MQPAQFFVHINQPGRHARKTAFALIGGIGDFDRIRDGGQKRLKALLSLALLGQSIELLFGFNDLLFRFALYIHTGCLRRDIIAHLDQLAADGQIVDHFGIIAHGKGGNCRAREPHQIGGPA